jgi:hypothetical protein
MGMMTCRHRYLSETMRLVFLFVLVFILLFGCLGLEKYFLFEEFAPGPKPVPVAQARAGENSTPSDNAVPYQSLLPSTGLPNATVNTTINASSNQSVSSGPKVYTNTSPPVPSSGGGDGGYQTYTTNPPSDELPPLPE